MPITGPSTIPSEGSSRAAPLGLCADVGGSFIKSAALGQDRSLAPAALRPTPVESWPEFCAALQDICAGLPGNKPLSLAAAGVVDPRSGRFLSANVPCLSGRHIATELQAALARPVLVANDAHCMVLAEALRGAGSGHAVVFGIVLGSGVGGGLVIDGRIVTGANGVAGEWGHGPALQILEVEGRRIVPQPCGCGQSGCLDTLGGARGLERLHGLMHGRPASSRSICEGWERQEGDATATVAAWLSIVAGPLAVLVNATGAGIVPVAGGLGNNHKLIAALDDAVRDRVLRPSAQPVVVPSRFGDDAGLIGAALRLQQSLGRLPG